MTMRLRTAGRALSAAAVLAAVVGGSAGVASAAPAAGSPFGAFDVAVGGTGTVSVRGWAIDPNAMTSPIEVHVYVDSMGTNLGPAQALRADVGARFPGTGQNHGFERTIERVAPGTRNVCAYAINVGAGSNVLLGCKTVNVAPAGNPFGAFDSATPTSTPGSVSLSGWAIDPDARTTSIEVHAYVGSRGWNLGAASATRNDVAAAHPGAGAAHGFNSTITGVPAGNQTVCLFGINVGNGSNSLLGCKTIRVADGSPIGVIDRLEASVGGVITLTGWAMDPDTRGATEIHMYIGRNGYNLGRSGDSRPDAQAASGASTPAIGYAVTGQDEDITGSSQNVCVFAINVGNGSNTLLGCRTLTWPGGNPFGALDSVTYNAAAQSVSISGWAIDPDVPSPIDVAYTINGALLDSTIANVIRADVGRAHPVYGSDHGFTTTINERLLPGNNRVCVTALNVLTGTSTTIGCRTITV